MGLTNITSLHFKMLILLLKMPTVLLKTTELDLPSDFD